MDDASLAGGRLSGHSGRVWPYRRGMRAHIAIPVALALAVGLTACSAAIEASPGPAPAAESTAPAPVQSGGTAEPPPSGSKPTAAGMATDRLADAVLEQLKIDSADTFTDQLVTIALSPLMRQLASTADVTTRMRSDGPRVRLTLAGSDSRCVITVTDEPRARGVVCRQV